MAMADMLERMKKRKSPGMPPPGEEKKPDLVVAVGIGKKKPGMGDDASDPDAPSSDDAADPDMSTPDGSSASPGNGSDDATDPGDGAKASDAEAIVLRADDKTCQSCMNWEPTDGSCSKVEGVFAPDDRCLRFYQASDGSPDTDNSQDMGSPDSMPPSAPPAAGTS
jgi:hypothetical protein